MTDNLISITIRPPYEEFSSMKIPMDLFIQYIEDMQYVVSLEKGKSAQKKGHTQKEGAFNHYQIGLYSTKHIDTIRRVINRYFKPYLSPSTKKKNVWKKVLKHNDKVSLIGYCQKEGHIYSTNIEQTKLQAELVRYLEFVPKKRPTQCNGDCNKDANGRKMLFLYTCSKCRFSKHSTILTGDTRAIKHGV